MGITLARCRLKSLRGVQERALAGGQSSLAWQARIGGRSRSPARDIRGRHAPGRSQERVLRVPVQGKRRGTVTLPHAGGRWPTVAVRLARLTCGAVTADLPLAAMVRAGARANEKRDAWAVREIRALRGVETAQPGGSAVVEVLRGTPRRGRSGGVTKANAMSSRRTLVARSPRDGCRKRLCVSVRMRVRSGGKLRPT